MKKIYLMPLLAATLLLSGCIDEEMPTDYASGAQVEKSSDALEKLLNGLTGSLVEYDTYSGSDGNSVDWGYPCQMVIRDVMCEDFPVKVTATNYDYYSYIADGTSLTVFPIYTYYYYSKIISTSNSLLSKAGGTQTTSNQLYAGVALAFRAMAYLDMARMFEFRETGYSDLDAKASGIWGQTVPIVTDTTTLSAARNNPRAPFYKMYRFINNDLTQAEQLLADQTRSRYDIPDLSVVYGLKARLWLELGSRFYKHADDLSTQLQHENDADGYAALGIQTANDCFQKAAEYAQKAMSGYSPVTKSQWYNKETGFNSSEATSAWMWCGVIGAKEQVNSWYYSWMGTLNSESNYSFGHYGTYRCISADLYSKMGDGDWRKKTWIDPNDTISGAVREGYTTVLDSAGLADLPEYTNLKFHPGSGNIDDYQVCLLCDIPLMRVEEMYYIYFEAIAHTQGVAAAKVALENYTNAYRYEDGSYTCQATDLDAFTKAVMEQKRLELWGEGLVYFDYKRLGLAVKRTYEGSNFSEEQRLNSKDGYVAPWMNYYFPEYETAYNPAAEPNPDPSGVVTAQAQ